MLENILINKKLQKKKRKVRKINNQKERKRIEKTIK
jgi:hypothetical protein